MKGRGTTFASAMMMVLVLGPMSTQAQTPEPAPTPDAAQTPQQQPAPEESFLTDYSKLKPSPDNPFDEMYLAPDALNRAAQYTAVMVDQPELFIHPDSKYKGIKPDDIKIIADTLREKVTAELKGNYQIVDKPGPNVLYMRFAIGDLLLQKKKRPVLAYLPVGAVVHAATNAAKEVTSKIDLKNMKLEGEILDSVSGEQLSAITTSRGSLSSSAEDPTKPVSWQELDKLFTVIGKRVSCRLGNAKVPEAQWQNCGAIGLAPEEEKKK